MSNHNTFVFWRKWENIMLVLVKNIRLSRAKGTWMCYVSYRTIKLLTGVSLSHANEQAIVITIFEIWIIQKALKSIFTKGRNCHTNQGRNRMNWTGKSILSSNLCLATAPCLIYMAQQSNVSIFHWSPSEMFIERFGQVLFIFVQADKVHTDVMRTFFSELLQLYKVPPFFFQ